MEAPHSKIPLSVVFIFDVHISVELPDERVQVVLLALKEQVVVEIRVAALLLVADHFVDSVVPGARYLLNDGRHLCGKRKSRGESGGKFLEINKKTPNIA